MPDHASLRLTGSFTFTAWIAPTSQRVGPPDQRVGAEGLLTKWQAGANPLGYAIGVDDGGRLALWLADGAGGVEALRADVALRPWIPAIPGPNQRPQGVADAYQHVVEQNNTANGANPGGTVNPMVRADMVYLEYPKGGAVFSTSAIAWCGSLSFNNYTNNVSRITENVLRRFASDAAAGSARTAHDGSRMRRMGW